MDTILPIYPCILWMALGAWFSKMHRYYYYSDPQTYKFRNILTIDQKWLPWGWWWDNELNNCAILATLNASKILEKLLGPRPIKSGVDITLMIKSSVDITLANTGQSWCVCNRREHLYRWIDRNIIFVYTVVRCYINWLMLYVMLDNQNTKNRHCVLCHAHV